MADVGMVTKIEGLLRKAERTTNEHEASAFMAKAQELMLKHAISEGMLDRERGQRSEPVVKTFDFGKNVTGIKAKRELMARCAAANRCKLWMNPGRRMLSIAGFEDDVDFVFKLYASVCDQMERACLLAYQASGAWDGAQTFKVNYYYGYVGRVGRRLMEAAEQAEQEARSSDLSTSTALVLADRSAAVAKVTPKLGSAPGARHTANEDAYARGRQDGNRANLAGGHRIGGAKGELH